MLLGDSQAWSLSTSGCLRRSFFVRFLYIFKALSRISYKLEDEEVV